MGVKLYEMTTTYTNLWELVGNEEIDLEQLDQTLKRLEGDMTEKLDSMAQIVKGASADIDYIKADKKRLDAKQKALENKVDRLKRYMQEQMEVAGIDKVKGSHYTVSVQNNAPSLEVVDESIIPKMYYVIPDPQLDKATVKDMLKHGNDIPGVKLSQSRSIRIK